MSYLKKHHDQRVTASASKGGSRSVKGSPTPQKKFSHVKDLNTELAAEEDEDYVEAKFKGLKLNNYSMHSVISSLTERVQAIDLSHNRIEDLPRELPKSVIGLNISYNKIQHFHVSKDLNHLIELNLSHNHITKATSLSVLTNIQYLNLGHNVLTVIEGLENMKSLKVLNLANNLIQDIKHLRTLSYNSKLEEIDVSSNPLNDNIEVKFLLKNLIPSIKFINEAPLKVDPNIYGYTQTLPNQLHHLHQQRGSIDALDSASVSTYPQRPFYQVKSHEAVENDEEGEEESLSWNQGLPAESLLPVMQGKQPQINHHPSMMHYFQPQPIQPSHFNLPPPSMSRDIVTNQPEQLDSPPSSLRNHSNDTINLQSSNPPNNNTPAPLTRKSRLPWRKPPNPLPRNWDQMQQSVIGSNSKKKLVQSPEEPPPQVSPPAPPVTQPPLMSLMMQVPPSQSFPPSYPFNHYQSNGLEGPGGNVSQFPEFHNPVNTMNTSMYDMSYMVPAPPPLPFETTGAFSQSNALNHHYGAPPPFHPALEEMSTSTIPPPLESTRSSRWLSPQLSQRHRSTSPDEGKRLKSYIALPFPDVLTTAKKSSAPSSPSNSPNHRNSGRRHQQQRSSVSPMSTSGRQNRYEKSPETRKAYELSQANVKRLEKQENLPAFIAMTERQKELLDDIRSTQEAARSTTASINGKERKQSPFDRLNKQKIGNTRRATSTSPTADSGGYGAKFRLKTRTVVSKPGSLSRRTRDEKESHVETETSPNLALVPLDKKIITDYEKRHPTPKKFSSTTSRGRERGGTNKIKSQQKKEGKDQEESKEKTKKNQENQEDKNNNNNNNTKDEENKDKKAEEEGGGSGGKEEASPYQRFLRLKERINVRYDRDLKKIYDDFHLTEEQVQDLLAATTGVKKVLPVTYQYLPSFEEEIEQAIEGPNYHKTRSTGIPQTHSHHTSSRTSSTPLTVGGGGGRMRTPSLASYNSTMMSLDSLQGTAVSPPPPYLLSSIAAANPTLSLSHNPTPVTSLEQEAFKLSQEIESLKMKKLHEITTNHSIHSINSSERHIPYTQPDHPSQPSPSPTLATIASEPILPSSSSHQNQIYDPRRYSSDDYMNKYNPIQVFNQVTNNQQRSLEYHLSFIQDMLHQKKPPSFNGMTSHHSIPEGGGNGSNKENSDDFSTNSGKFVFPSLALYENSPNNRMQSYPTPSTTTMMMTTPMTNVTSKQSQPSPTNSLIRELPILSEEKTSNPEEVMKFIDRSFDHLHSENLNFQEMQQAIESLKQQQLISLQRIQRQ